MCRYSRSYILKAPKRTNKQQLQSYLGLLHHYYIAPLYKLLQKNVEWKWDKTEPESCFENSKKLLLTSKVLMPFNPIYPIVLSCDASPYGVGAVLVHILPNGDERPIMYASATL